MKMKFVFALFLVLLVAIWANPDYSESDNDDGSKSFAIVQTASRKEVLSRNHSESNDDGCRGVKTVQKATLKTEDVLHVNNDEDQMVTKLRRKRGILKSVLKAVGKSRKSRKSSKRSSNSRQKGEREEDEEDKESNWNWFGNDNDNGKDNDKNDDSSGDGKSFSFFSSGSSTFNATRNVFIVLVLLAFQCLM